MKIVKNVQVLLLSLHIKGLINISKHVDISNDRRLPLSTTYIGYNMFAKGAYYIIKNNLEYSIDESSGKANLLYKYLKKNKYIRSLGLNVFCVDYEEVKHISLANLIEYNDNSNKYMYITYNKKCPQTWTKIEVYENSKKYRSFVSILALM